jgi:hypothetical protein
MSQDSKNCQNDNVPFALRKTTTYTWKVLQKSMCCSNSNYESRTINLKLRSEYC